MLVWEFLALTAGTPAVGALPARPLGGLFRALNFRRVEL
ncbi:hypothetical protein PLANPX_4566 [Lacipirellula parvula]|uniref:Uncharacterized protein n=1 Tax=Lacipirellula parvula TaxID=2650471 RepID=A0A5K7XDQ2_9BACT|nr:hypothetical protein PLANPX_4566 [Lacipirellula parvula]